MAPFRWLRQLPKSVWNARVALAWATLSGVGVFLSFPAWNLFPLAFVALIPLLRVCESTSTRRAFGLAWWMGVVTNVGGFYWIINLLEDYGYMPWSLSAFLYLLLCMQQAFVWALGFGIGRWATQRGLHAAPAYAAGIAISETLIPLIFPWHFGNSQSLFYAFIQSAELGGVVLLSALVVLANVALREVGSALMMRRRPATASLVVIGLLVLNTVYGMVRIGQVDREIAAAETLRIGLVQANIGIYDKGTAGGEAERLLLHQQMSAELAADGAELILWPETAYEAPSYRYEIDGSLRESGMLSRIVTRMVPSSLPLPPLDTPDEIGRNAPAHYVPQRGFEVPVLVGAVMLSERDAARLAEAPPRYGRPRPYDIHNAALLLDEDGTVLGVYDKTYRMIFSEYIPGGWWLWQRFGVNLYDMIPSAGDFFGGQPTEGFLLPHNDRDVRLGIMICYEDIMPEFGRAIHAGRPEVLLNLTNDAWFGDTAEPALHLALAVFRSIEQRAMLVRSTNTGISAFVDPVGRIVAATPTFERTALAYDAPLMGRTTPFMTFGNWSFPLGLVLVVGAGIRRRFRVSVDEAEQQTEA